MSFKTEEKEKKYLSKLKKQIKDINCKLHNNDIKFRHIDEKHQLHNWKTNIMLKCPYYPN